MKLVQWHKLANESSLQAFLIRTNKTRLNKKASKQQLEREARAAKRELIQKATEKEDSKPLLTDRKHMVEIEEEDHRNRITKAGRVQTRLESVDKLKEMVGQREETRSRRAKCDAIRRKMREEQSQQMSSAGACKSALRRRGMGSSMSSYWSYFQNETKEWRTQISPPPVETSLPSVLMTLDKVMSLEERIRQLSESQNIQAQDWLLVARASAADEAPLRKALSRRRETVIVKATHKQSSQQTVSSFSKQQSPVGSAEAATSQTMKPPLTNNEMVLYKQVDAETTCHLSSAYNDEEPESESHEKNPDKSYFPWTKSVPGRSDSFDYLKIVTNVPSQDSINNFDKLKRARRKSC